MSHEILSSAIPIEQLKERFSTRLPDEKALSTAYGAAPRIHTKLKISHAQNGELKVVCESPKYAQYLMAELRKIRGKDGEGLNCFYAKNTDDCACFYIAASKKIVHGQNTIIRKDDRFAAENHHIESDASIPDNNNELNHYGVYQSKGDEDGHNKKLSLRCPNGYAGRRAVEVLLGLDKLRTDGIERHGDTFYFDPDELPYEVGNVDVIETEITINNGLRRSVREEEVEEKSLFVEPETEESKEITVDTDSKSTPKAKIKTYTGEDANLVLSAAIQMTAPNQYWSYEDKENSHDRMFVLNGTAYQQSGFKGGDHETLSLKWVNDKGEMKLAVSYYCYQDCFLSTVQKAATYLISFNETGSAMTTELIHVEKTEAISVANILKQQKDNSWAWEPIKGDVYVPTGGEVIDALTEWSRAFNTKKLELNPVPTPDKSFAFSEWSKSKNGLEVFLKSRNLLLSSDNECAQEMMVQLHNKILNDISAGEEGSYIERLDSVKGIIKILQEVNKNSTTDNSEEQKTKAEKFPFDQTQKREVTRHFRTLLNTAPTWKEKNFIQKAIIACGLIIPVVGWLPLLIWDYRKNRSYQEKIRQSAKDVAGVEIEERSEDSYISQRMNSWRK